MNHTVQRMIWVMNSLPRIILTKLLYRNRFEIDWFEHFEYGIRMTSINYGLMKIGRACHIKRGTELSVANRGVLILGEHVCINNNCYIASRNSVIIGEGTMIAPNVVIVDHDHDFKALGGIREGKFKCCPVKIGKKVWIGANTVILKGSILGDNCIVGAGCVISGIYSDNSVIVQKRNEKTYNYELIENYD